MPTSVYEERFQAANSLFDDNPEECIRLAKSNLADRTLPPYYVIENCILIACALDDWDTANKWRLSAEQAYYTSYAEALRRNDRESLDQLKNVRIELDQLKAFGIEDIYGTEDVDVDMAEQELLEDVDGFDFEDAEAVADAKNQDEVEADKMTDLAIRDANPTS